MCRAESSFAPEQATVAQVVRLLPSFQLHNTSRPTSFRALMVQDRWATVSAADVWWSIFDNGGELMVERINSGELARACPLTWWSAPLNALTVAFRVACILRGEAIDFEQRLSNEDQETMMAAQEAGSWSLCGPPGWPEPPTPPSPEVGGS